MLDEYLSLYDMGLLFGAEIAARVLELLKFFNATTCQLVLGAGALRTAGLRSISAKQLALSCQVRCCRCCCWGLRGRRCWGRGGAAPAAPGMLRWR